MIIYGATGVQFVRLPLSFSAYLYRFFLGGFSRYWIADASCVYCKLAKGYNVLKHYFSFPSCI